MRIEKSAGGYLALWHCGAMIWLQLIWIEFPLFRADRFNWSDLGTQWGVSFRKGKRGGPLGGSQVGGVWFHWKDHSWPPRRWGLPFVGRP